jgi:hypothetical protein
MSDGGKGSKPRPYSVSQEEYDTRWDAIFSRDLKVKEEATKALEQQTQTENERLDIYKKD